MQGIVKPPKRTVSVAGSRVAVRLTVRSTSAEIVSAIEADKPAFVQVRGFIRVVVCDKSKALHCLSQAGVRHVKPLHLPRLPNSRADQSAWTAGIRMHASTSSYLLV